MTPSPEAEGLLTAVTDIRAAGKQFADLIKNLKTHPFLTLKLIGTEKTDHGEMIANIMLAYRAAEDARMRLGKVFEAYYGEGIGNGPLQTQQK
jgi:hypothetical protein